jgi:hypothetical protein
VRNIERGADRAKRVITVGRNWRLYVEPWRGSISSYAISGILIMVELRYFLTSLIPACVKRGPLLATGFSASAVRALRNGLNFEVYLSASAYAVHKSPISSHGQSDSDHTKTRAERVVASSIVLRPV